MEPGVTPPRKESGLPDEERRKVFAKEYFTLPGQQYKPFEVWFPLSEDILAWDQDFHELMLNDQIRMRAYEAGIKEVIKPGMTIVDLGTGTGILSLWAAEAGAKKIYGIDANENRQQAAEARLNEAGFGLIYEFKLGLSYDVGLPEKADVIISEILGNLADNEDMTPILKDARQRFLKPGGLMLPRQVSTFITPVSAMESHTMVEQMNIRGINPRYNLGDLMSELGQKSQYDLYYDAILPTSSYLASPEKVAEFNFTDIDEATYNKRLLYKVEKPGQFSGFKGHFDAILSDQTDLEIGGDNIAERQTSDCWKHCYLPIETPVQTRPGDVINLELERYYPTQKSSAFRQGYAWSGSVERNGQVIANFSQQTAKR